ncbi:hypothetical protein HYALB_00011936 [Hymenoscyphus albidus]|uniref:Clr5 domain-containing protein n=1 Tax=Hymenoscyphus albidus TaxID=595503 RepID=A0A9N9LME9_9HELO|nr:hypothetical protein HYALB_00011936 [Hymenoscyphus albidus]
MDMPTSIVPPAGGKRRAPKARTMTAKDWKKYEDRLKQFERQLKVKVQKMKLERNSKPGDRRAVIRHIQHRMIINKNCSRVRIRGHEISAEKLGRWFKDFAPQFSFMPARSPSPLPSCISMYTSSQFGSPGLTNTRLLAGLPTTGLIKPNDESSAVIERLLKYAGTPTNAIQNFEARSVFNDLQTILPDDHNHEKIRSYWQMSLSLWNPRVEDDLMRVRNMMNMNLGAIKIDKIAGKAYPKEFSAARIVVLPSQARSRVVVDFTPGLDPWAKIIYQATIPRGSRVFQIIESGNLHRLMEVIQEGTASLTDRDEDGCSLLNVYADILLKKVQTLMQLSAIYVLWIVWDPSIQSYGGAGVWDDSLVRYIIDGSLEDLRHVLDYGRVFLDLKKSRYIHKIADCCGYAYSDALSIVDKAITLIKRGIDISSRINGGDTVLHTILRCEREHEQYSRNKAWRSGGLWAWEVSLKAPKDLIMACISAGADVYVKNDAGETPSMIAQAYGRVKEWSEALTECGFYAPSVLGYSDSKSSSEEFVYERQKSKLSFDEFCRKREREPQIKEGRDPSYNDQLCDEGSGDESSGDVGCSTSNEEPTAEDATVLSNNHDDTELNVSTEEMDQDSALSGFKNAEDMSSETFTTGIDLGTGSFTDGMDFGYDDLAASQPDFLGASFDFDAYLNEMM